MHIPDGMMSGAICPVTAVLAVAGIAAASYAAVRASDKPSPVYLGAVAALIFAAQMINFPVLNGSSGHLLGGILAVALLGVPFAVLTMALIVSLQALLFADGGVMVLGANVMNMALIGTGLCGLVLRYASARMERRLALGLVAWCSTVVAALACSVELGLSGAITLSKVIPAMLSMHALIGVGEALITLMVFELLARLRSATPGWQSGVILLGAALTAVMLSPLASSYPDGLESVAQQYDFLTHVEPLFTSPLAHYTFAQINHDVLSRAVAGLFGVLLLALLASSVGCLLLRLKPRCRRVLAHI